MSSEFTVKLLDWNATSNHRSMPWKGEPDPYKIWLSEIILQQTRVEQGMPYYERFIAAFPTVHDLAAAPEQEVFKLWEGLGYYTRCKNLIHSAKTISTLHNGKFPSSYEEILKLKGIGPYTASAIASFAFREARAVVDGNVQRVIARYFGISTPIDSGSGKKMYNDIAQSLIDLENPGLYNQAIMDFGATICKPRNPLCSQCIQSEECEALKHGFANMLPVKEKTLKKRSRWLYYFIIENGDSVYIRKRTESDIWQSLHEFVLLETDGPEKDPAPAFLNKLLQRQAYAIRFTSDVYSQQLTHQRIQGKFIVVTIANDVSGLSKKPSSTIIKELSQYELIPKSKVREYAFPKFINTFLLESPSSPI